METKEQILAHLNELKAKKPSAESMEALKIKASANDAALVAFAKKYGITPEEPTAAAPAVVSTPKAPEPEPAPVVIHSPVAFSPEPVRPISVPAIGRTPASGPSIPGVPTPEDEEKDLHKAIDTVFDDAEGKSTAPVMHAAPTPASPRIPSPATPTAESKKAGSLLEKMRTSAENVPGFQDLTKGQQDIVMNVIASRLQTNIQKEARSDFAQRMQNKRFLWTTWKDLGSIDIPNPFVKVDQFGHKKSVFKKSRPMKDIHGDTIEQEWHTAKAHVTINPGAFLGKISKNLRKNFLTAKYEKEKYEDLDGTGHSGLSGNIVRKEFLEKNIGGIMHVVQERDLQSYQEQGKMVVDYSTMGNEFAGSPDKKNILESYNQAATALANIPYEWTIPDATNDQNEAFQTARKAYQKAEAAYLLMLRDSTELHGRKQPEVFVEEKMGESRALIQTMQFYSAHPDAAKMVEKIGTDSTFLRGLSDTGTERGLYMAAGFGLRRSGMLGAMANLAAPAVGAIIGAWRGADRAKKAQIELNKLGRYGERQKGENVIGMGDIERHIDRLQKKLDEANTANPDDRAQALYDLKTRADFLEAKLSLGQVNFGKEYADASDPKAEESRFARQSMLSQLLKEAKVMLAVEDIYNGNGHLYDEASAFETVRDNTGKMIFAEHNTGRDGRILPEEQRFDGTVRHDLRQYLSLDVDPKKHKYKGYSAYEVTRGFGFVNQGKWQIAKRNYVIWGALKGAALGAFFGEAGAKLAEVYGPLVHGTPPIEHGATSAPSHVSHTPTAEELKQQVHDAHARELGRAASKIGRTPPASQTDASGPAPQETSTVSAANTPTKITAQPGATATEAAIKTTFGKGEGLGKVIEHFKESSDFDNLPADVKKFFEANPNTVARNMNAIDAQGRSVSFGQGSEFSVTKNGNDYVVSVKDTNHGGQSYEIGRFKDGHAFTKGDEDLTYIKPKTGAPRAETPTTPTAPKPKPIIEFPTRPEDETVLGTTVSPKINPTKLLDPKETIAVEHAAHRDVIKTVDNTFGKTRGFLNIFHRHGIHGHDFKEFKNEYAELDMRDADVIDNIPAKSLLNNHAEDLIGHKQAFLHELNVLRHKYHIEPLDHERTGHYAERLFQAEETAKKLAPTPASGTSAAGDANNTFSGVRYENALARSVRLETILPSADAEKVSAIATENFQSMVTRSYGGTNDALGGWQASKEWTTIGAENARDMLKEHLADTSPKGMQFVKNISELGKQYAIGPTARETFEHYVKRIFEARVKDEYVQSMRFEQR